MAQRETAKKTTAAKRPATKAAVKKTAGATKKSAGKPERKSAGSDRVAALASRFQTSPTALRTQAGPGSDNPAAVAAMGALIGLSPVPDLPPEPPRVEDTAVDVEAVAKGGPEGAGEALDERASVDETIDDLVGSPAESSADVEDVVTEVVTTDQGTDQDSDDGADQATDQDAAADEPLGKQAEEVVDATPTTLSLVPERGANEPEAASTLDDTSTTAVAPVERPRSVSIPAQRPAAKKAPARRKPAARTEWTEAQQAERLDDLVWMLSDPGHSLDQQHDRISKLSVELPVPLVDVLSRWELDQVRRTGRRVFRERLIDLALAELPQDPEKVIAMAREIPVWLKYAETEQVGSRVRASIAFDLKVMKQELKMRREKGTYLRHIYAVAIMDFLSSYGVEVTDPEL